MCVFVCVCVCVHMCVYVKNDIKTCVTPWHKKNLTYWALMILSNLAFEVNCVIAFTRNGLSLVSTFTIADLDYLDLSEQKLFWPPYVNRLLNFCGLDMNIE